MVVLTAAAILLSLGFLRLASSAAPNPSPPTVDTGYAVYIGHNSLPNTAAFLGIPYAEPPVGERRWRAPTPLDTRKLEENKAVVDAATYPDFCVQGTTGGGDAGGAGSEDCLKVNIYTPINATKESNLPVLVYFHGGGYIYGNPANWPFDHWINQSPTVVIVSVYYRLNVFGFLAHPALRRSLNAGFIDQTEALRWVQSHIRAFGGDPARVTISGQSAGANSVELHLVAYGGGGNKRSPPLFSGAIAQSVSRTPMPAVEDQMPLFEYLLQNTSCALPTAVEQLSCLRKASVSALIRSSDSASHFFPGAYKIWVPVVDGTVFTDAPTKSIREGKFAKVPIMAGSTSNETILHSGNITADLMTFYPRLTASEIQQISNLYPESAFANDRQRSLTITGDATFHCGRELLGGAAAKANLPAFAYRYNQRNPTSDGDIVDHSAENWMMFLGTNTGTNGSTVFTGLNPVETAFSQELIAYWLSFVRSANPSTFRLARSPEWPALSSGKRQVLQQDVGNSTTVSGIVPEAEPQADVQRCQFYFSLAEVMQN
ncbi:alpha/beta-hydrolase [Hysterangium stoloniferum]|nr:alpha/beta-hydrolase [Hysterangium stoloniferum]